MRGLPKERQTVIAPEDEKSETVIVAEDEQTQEPVPEPEQTQEPAPAPSEPEQTPEQTPEPTVTGDTPVGAEPAPAPTQDEVRDALTAVLSRPKTKDSIMTLSTFGDGPFRRYFLLDVDGELFTKAWQTYKDMTGTKDTDAFLMMVYGILDCSLPRLHRAVSWVPLD